MAEVKTFTFITLTVIIAFLAISCSDNSGGTNSAENDLEVVSIHPSPGASDVPLDATISMKFSTAMDTASFRHGFHLSGGPEMLRWMDSAGHHRGMDGHGYQDMQHMYEWMDSIAYRGQYNWNVARDSCWFVPDSTLMPNARHMIMIEGTVHDRRGRMMGHRDAGDFIDYHFTTRPATVNDSQ